MEIARFLGEGETSGVVRAGARAGLVLMDGNPLADVATSLRISGVMVNGPWIGPGGRAALRDALASTGRASQ